MDTVTNGFSLFYRSRLKTIESYRQKADSIQQEQLKKLIRFAQKTTWGITYDYRTIRDYKTFAQRVPLQTYDTLKHLIERMINGEKNILWPSAVKWYAKSSGTTNDKSKFIPVTHEILRHCHYRGGYDTVGIYLGNNPQSRLLSKKGLILGGSHTPSPLNKHAHCGDLSAVLIQNIPSWVNQMRVPNKKIILMDEWEAKMKAIVEHTWNKNIGNISGVPSWMLVLIKALLQKTGCENLTEVWPNLEVFFHGGISFDPYRSRYTSLISSDKMHYMETYNASEGFFGIQNDPTDSSLLLMLDYGTFYEFIPINEYGDDQQHEATAIPLEEVKTGQNYAMIITTSGGLWRYNIGDTVRFTSLYPHKFVITGRTKHFINAFGEELMVDNAEKAIRIACQQTGATIIAYTAAPLFLLDKAKGRHQWLIEFENTPESIDQFALILDQTLQKLNSDYEAKRYKDISLQPLEIIPARKNVFFEWLKTKGKLGGQHKVPALSNNRKIIEELLIFNQKNTD